MSNVQLYCQYLIGETSTIKFVRKGFILDLQCFHELEDYLWGSLENDNSIAAIMLK